MPYDRRITRHCFVNAPFLQLKGGLLRTFVDNRLQPEIGLEGALDKCGVEDFAAIAETLADEGLPYTLHAPFLGLDPGIKDLAVRLHSGRMMQQAFDLLDIFKPLSIVCHPHLVYGVDELLNAYRLDLSLEFWSDLVEFAAVRKVPVMFENTYEKSVQGHLDFLQRLNHPNARFCLDVGHVLAFARNTWQDWLPALEPWLGQLHLHDNNGVNDDHVAIGAGTFDFEDFFAYLTERKLKPLLTLEPHSAENLHGSLDYLAGCTSFLNYLAKTRYSK